jgi:hypothetical protein
VRTCNVAPPFLRPNEPTRYPHALAPTSSPPGTEDGKVYFADDLGHMTEVQALSSSVDCMKFYGDKSRLVIITRALLMVQLQVGDDGRVTPVMKVKLSIAGSGEKSIKQVYSCGGWDWGWGVGYRVCDMCWVLEVRCALGRIEQVPRMSFSYPDPLPRAMPRYATHSRLFGRALV